jgi:hypothetical protein
MLLKSIFLLILFKVNVIQIEGKPIHRKFIQTKEELSLIKLEPILDADPCADHQSVSIFITSSAKTTGKSYHKRQAERKTWVSEAKENNISVYFVVGLSEDNKTNQLLRDESDKYQDMIQMQFIDSYYNLTLKSLSILFWAQNKCKKSKIIIKTDQDVIVNINLLLDSLDQFKPGITGFKEPNELVYRDPAKKWWFPKRLYKPDVYPPLVFGGFYAITTDVIPKLLETLDTYSDTVLDLEDVFVTGLLTERAGVPRHQSPYVTKMGGCPLERTCKMSKLLVLAHCVSGQELTQFYETWKKTIGSTVCPITGSFERSFLALIFCLIIVIQYSIIRVFCTKIFSN